MAVAVCLRTGLPPAWCRHCRINVDIAQESDRCPRCLQTIRTGELFGRDDEGVLCEECIEELDE